MAATELLIAFGGGLASFVSPCVLPLVPAYLSVSTGLSPADLSEGGRNRLRAARGAALFIAGFSSVFVVLGLSATALGSLLLARQVELTRVAGALVAVLAVLLVAGTLRAPWGLSREVRFHPDVRRLGTWGAPMAGAAFAFGWTPCIGPVLGSVLAVAAHETSTTAGAVLLAAYAAGLGVPFLAAALAFERLLGVRRWAARHARLLTRGAALVLAVYGALLVTGQLTTLTLRLQGAG